MFDLNPSETCFTTRLNLVRGIDSSVLLCSLRISRRALTPGLQRLRGWSSFLIACTHAGCINLRAGNFENVHVVFLVLTIPENGEGCWRAFISSHSRRNVQVRSFDLHTTEVQRIALPDAGRPEHFLRPTNDLSFATTGVYSMARSVGRFMPEDAMHCGFLFPLAETFKCDVMEVPGNEVYAPYEILPDRYYATWAPATGEYGTVMADTNARIVGFNLHEQGDDEAIVYYSMPVDSWENKLREMGAVLPPMIWRSGACVMVEGTDVGVLIPYTDATGKCNFDPGSCTYQILVGSADHTIHLPFRDVLRTLVPVGTVLGLKMDSPAGEQLLGQLPSRWATCDLIQVRLNVPTVADPEPGKAYVTYVMRPTVAHTEISEITSATVAVDPWDLALPGDNAMAEYLHARV